MSPARTRIAVVFGGRSGEHEVSLRSAEAVLQALDPAKYDVVPIAITHEGRWLTSDAARQLAAPKKMIEDTLRTGESVVMSPEPAGAAAVDVVFPVLHGTFGEDGTIQGL